MVESKVIEKNYEIYSDGKLKNLKTNNFLKGSIKENGVTVQIGNKKCMLHRLVGESFIPNPSNFSYIIHLNNDKTDNRVENLKWGMKTEMNTTKTHPKNKLGYTGITIKNGSGVSCSWYINNKKHKKLFSISSYGFEGAYRKAIVYKHKQDELNNIKSHNPDIYFQSDNYKQIIKTYSEQYKHMKVVSYVDLIKKNKSYTGYKNVKINHYWGYIEYTREDEEYEYSASISYSSNSESLKHPKVITFKEALDKAVSLLHKKNLENDKPIYMTPEEYFETDVYKHIIEKYNVIE